MKIAKTDIGWYRRMDGLYHVFFKSTGSVIYDAFDLDTPINAHGGALALYMRQHIRAAEGRTSNV